MPTVALTKRMVEDAKPEHGEDGQPRRTIYFDRDVKGFGLLVTERGAKSFVLKYRAGAGRAAPTRRVTIGRYGSPWTVEQARGEAKRLLGEVALGRDPAAERAAKRRGADEGQAVSAVVEQWLRRDQAGNRTAEEVRRIMAREVLPYIGQVPVAEVRKRDIMDIIDRVADRAPVRANRVLAHVKRLFRWAAGRDIIEFDPSAHILKRTAERPRERVLSDAELLAVWRAAESMGGPYGRGVRLLIATGARRAEIFELRWSEVDHDDVCIRLPAERNKVNRVRIIPLSPLAMCVLGESPACGDFVLATRGGRSFSNLGFSKARLNERVARMTGAALPAWRLHDLRRTVATGLQRLGARLEAIEAVLGHVSGSRAGIVGVYQRHRFEAEAREALALWGAHLQRLLDGASATAEVVPLRRA
jgi:integrase